MNIEEKRGQIQSRLFLLAGIYLVLHAVALTISPAVRSKNWNIDLNWDHWIGVGVWLLVFLIVHIEIKKRLPNSDPFLVPLAGLLTGIGLLTIWRLDPYFGKRQLIWIVLGVAMFILGLRLPPSLAFLRKYKYLWLVIGILLTGLTVVWGVNPSGSGPKLWLGCCDFYFQPSEPLKLLLIAYLAAYLADRQYTFSSTFTFLAPTFIMGVVVIFLLINQQDLGTAFIFWFIYTSIIYLSTGKRNFILTSVFILIILGIIGYWLFDVVRLRVDAWINPWSDPAGRSYQIVQSLIAIANGQILGRGPGLGNPELVPVAHSDFIFTSLIEEAGLLGGLGLILLLALFLNRGLRIALYSPDTYRRYVAGGLVTYLIGQSILIIGGNTKLLPLTGVTLPFVAYGGSSLVFSYVALLILVLISSVQADNVPHPSPNPKPFVVLSGILMTGLFALGTINVYWSAIINNELLDRTDNFRRNIGDQFVKRGQFVDRNNTPLTSNLGSPGNYERYYLFPTLSPIIGYSSSIYGQSGLEASLDSFLRGLTGTSSSTIWVNNLLYGYHPPGLNVRLSIDLKLQQTADEFFDEKVGAVIVLDARSGELLVMGSYPFYDPNSLNENWETIINQDNAPLLNRTTQGQYPTNHALGVFILADFLSKNLGAGLPENIGNVVSTSELTCSYPIEKINWESLLRAGCHQPLTFLIESKSIEELLSLFSVLGLYSTPNLWELPVSPAVAPLSSRLPEDLIFGSDSPVVTPLQMALAVATISNTGFRPSPRLAIATKAEGEPWKPLSPPNPPIQTYLRETASETASLLSATGKPIWETVSTISDHVDKDSDNAITWFLGGTSPAWEGLPLVTVVLLENNDPELAIEIGESLLMQAIQP